MRPPLKKDKEKLLRHDKDGLPPLPRSFEMASQVVIVISLFIYSIQTLPQFRDHVFFTTASKAIIGFYIVEYCYRIFKSKPAFRYMTSFFGIIDFLSIAPILVTLGSVDWQFARAARLILMARIFRMVKFSKAMRSFTESLREIKDELVIYSIVTLIIIYLSSVGIYNFEKEAQPTIFKSIFHAMWWSIETLTTVGYGDIYPVTTGGKIFAAILLYASVGMIAVPSALFASALTKTRIKQKDDAKDT
jgi:voltage-gated potassium channel